jgi:methylthioribose-1-phosphate isomerase
MEIVLTVAIAVVAAAGLYVAATFSKRTRQTTAPLLEAAVSDISAQMRATADDLRRQLQAITDDLHHDREQQKLDGRKILGRLDHADSRISSMANQVLAELDAIKRRGEQIGTRQDQLSGDLQQLATRRTGDPGPLG